MRSRARLLSLTLLAGAGCRGEDVARRVVTVREQVRPDVWASRTCAGWMRIDARLEGASPAMVEQLVSTHVEQSLRSIDGVRGIASHAGPARAAVWISIALEPAGSAWAIAHGAGLDASLPEDAFLDAIVLEPPWLHTTVVAVGSASDPEIAERTASELLQRLQRLPGVRHVGWIGAPPFGVTVRIDRARLSAFGLTKAAVEAKLRTAHWNLPRKHVYAGGIDPEALPELQLVARPDGTTIRLADVADVVEERLEGPPPPRASGRPVTVLLVQGSEPDAIAGAVRDTASLPGVEAIVVGAVNPTPSTCAHPLVGASIEGSLQAVAIGLPEGAPAAVDLARRFPEGVWIFQQPDVFSGPGGAVRTAQWLATADTEAPDFASVPGVTILARAAPGLRTIAIAISGVDRPALQSTADTLRSALRDREEDVLDDPPPRSTLTYALTDEARAAGLRPGDLAAAASASSDVPGVTTWNGRPIRLVTSDEPAIDVEAADVAVPIPNGGTAPLSSLATVHREPTPDLTRLDSMPVHLVHVTTRDPTRTRATIDAEIQALRLPPSTTARILE